MSNLIHTGRTTTFQPGTPTNARVSFFDTDSRTTTFQPGTPSNARVSSIDTECRVTEFELGSPINSRITFNDTGGRATEFELGSPINSRITLNSTDGRATKYEPASPTGSVDSRAAYKKTPIGKSKKLKTLSSNDSLNARVTVQTQVDRSTDFLYRPSTDSSDFRATYQDRMTRQISFPAVPEESFNEADPLSEHIDMLHLSCRVLREECKFSRGRLHASSYKWYTGGQNGAAAGKGGTAPYVGTNLPDTGTYIPEIEAFAPEKHAVAEKGAFASGKGFSPGKGSVVSGKGSSGQDAAAEKGAFASGKGFLPGKGSVASGQGSSGKGAVAFGSATVPSKNTEFSGKGSVASGQGSSGKGAVAFGSATVPSKNTEFSGKGALARWIGGYSRNGANVDLKKPVGADGKGAKGRHTTHGKGCAHGKTGVGKSATDAITTNGYGLVQSTHIFADHLESIESIETLLTSDFTFDMNRFSLMKEYKTVKLPPEDPSAILLTEICERAKVCEAMAQKVAPATPLDPSLSYGAVYLDEHQNFVRRNASTFSHAISSRKKEYMKRVKNAIFAIYHKNGLMEDPDLALESDDEPAKTPVGDAEDEHSKTVAEKRSRSCSSKDQTRIAESKHSKSSKSSVVESISEKSDEAGKSDNMEKSDEAGKSDMGKEKPEKPASSGESMRNPFHDILCKQLSATNRVISRWEWSRQEAEALLSELKSIFRKEEDIKHERYKTENEILRVQKRLAEIKRQHDVVSTAISKSNEFLENAVVRSAMKDRERCTMREVVASSRKVLSQVLVMRVTHTLLQKLAGHGMVIRVDKQATMFSNIRRFIRRTQIRPPTDFDEVSWKSLQASARAERLRLKAHFKFKWKLLSWLSGRKSEKVEAMHRADLEEVKGQVLAAMLSLGFWKDRLAKEEVRKAKLLRIDSSPINTMDVGTAFVETIDKLTKEMQRDAIKKRFSRLRSLVFRADTKDKDNILSAPVEGQSNNGLKLTGQSLSKGLENLRTIVWRGLLAARKPEEPGEKEPGEKDKSVQKKSSRLQFPSPSPKRRSGGRSLQGPRPSRDGTSSQVSNAGTSPKTPRTKSLKSSRQPSRQTSRAPSQQPSRQTSRAPSRQPSRAPSRQTSRAPSRQTSRTQSRLTSRKNSAKSSVQSAHSSRRGSCRDISVRKMSLADLSSMLSIIQPPEDSLNPGEEPCVEGEMARITVTEAPEPPKPTLLPSFLRSSYVIAKLLGKAAKARTKVAKSVTFLAPEETPYQDVDMSEMPTTSSSCDAWAAWDLREFLFDGCSDDIQIALMKSRELCVSLLDTFSDTATVFVALDADQDSQLCSQDLLLTVPHLCPSIEFSEEDADRVSRLWSSTLHRSGDMDDLTVPFDCFAVHTQLIRPVQSLRALSEFLVEQFGSIDMAWERMADADHLHGALSVNEFEVVVTQWGLLAEDAAVLFDLVANGTDHLFLTNLRDALDECELDDTRRHSEADAPELPAILEDNEASESSAGDETEIQEGAQTPILEGAHTPIQDETQTPTKQGSQSSTQVEAPASTARKVLRRATWSEAPSRVPTLPPIMEKWKRYSGQSHF